MKVSSPGSRGTNNPSPSKSLAQLAGLVLFFAFWGPILSPMEGVGQEAPPQIIDLTLERMVELSLSSSYQIRRLNL